MIKDNLQALRDILDRMLHDNISISARAVVREKDSPFKHASNITRYPKLTAILDEYQERQGSLRALHEKTNHLSNTNLRNRVASLTQINEHLKSDRDLLIASHRAMILAVGEVGGMAAWRRFFPMWDQVRDRLTKLNALPSAEIKSIS